MRLNVVLLCAVGFISVPSIHSLSIEPFDVSGDGLISAPGYVCTAPCTNTRACGPGCVCTLYNITCAGGAICSVVSGRNQLFCLCPSGTTQLGGNCVSNGATPSTPTTAATTTKKPPAPPTCSGFSFQRCYPTVDKCGRRRGNKCKRQSICEPTDPNNNCPCPSRHQPCFFINIVTGAITVGGGNGRKKRDVGSDSPVTIDHSPAVVRKCNQVSKPRRDGETKNLELFIEFEAGVNVSSCTTKLQETYVDETESDLKKYNFCTLKDFLYNNKKNHISTRSFVGVDVEGSIGQFILTRPGPPEGPKGGYLIQRYSVFCTNTYNEMSTTEYFYVAFPNCQTCKFQKHRDNCPDAKRHMHSRGKENSCSDPVTPVGDPCLPTFSCTPDPSRILTLDGHHWHKAIGSSDFEDSGLTSSSSDEQPVDLDNSTPETTQHENAEAAQDSSEAGDESTTSEPSATDVPVDDDNKDSVGNEDASSIGLRAFAQSSKSASSDSGVAVSGSAKSQSSSEDASSSADK